MSKEIDAIAVAQTTEANDTERFENKRSSKAKKVIALGFVIIFGGIGAVVSYKLLQRAKDIDTNQQQAPSFVNTKELNIAPITTPPESSSVGEPIDTGRFSTAEAIPLDDLALRRMGSKLIGDFQPPARTENQSGGASEQTEDVGGGALGQQLQPYRTVGAKAQVMMNRDYMITQGTMAECILQTQLVSTVSGMAVCYTSRDIYSTNGRVKLLEKGSKVVGFYQGGINRGQNRIGVTWSRVETPEGVIVNIDSPGASALGSAGVEGNVDHHFWERFGASIMISLFNDGMEIVKTRAEQAGQRKGDNTNYGSTTIENTQDLVTEIFRSTADIPPTLYVNQGTRVSIIFARDLDFTGVYKLSYGN